MKSFRIALFVALALVASVALTGCNQGNVAAKVNGETITVEELETQVEQLKKQYPQMFEGAEGEGRLLDFKQRLLDNLISQKLVAQAAEEKGVKISDADVDKQIEQLKAGFKDDAQFETALKSAGMSLEALQQQVRDQLLTQKLIEAIAKSGAASEAEIKAYYDKNKTQFFQAQAKRASHILFKPEDKETAEQVLKQIKDGNDFAALAKQYSTDEATKNKGGDLGWPTTPYVAEFEKALKSLDKGEVSGLVKTPYGWHIIKVTDERKGTQQSLADVKDQIAQILVQQARADSYQKYLDGLRKDADIEILLPELKASVTSQETTSK